MVFNTLAATNVFAIASDEYNNYPSENSSENYYDKSENSHNSYDGYYDDYENGYYEDRYGKLYYIE